MAGAGMHGYAGNVDPADCGSDRFGSGQREWALRICGNLGGFTGPLCSRLVENRTGNFTAAMWFLVACVYFRPCWRQGWVRWREAGISRKSNKSGGQELSLPVIAVREENQIRFQCPRFSTREAGEKVAQVGAQRA